MTELMLCKKADESALDNPIYAGEPKLDGTLNRVVKKEDEVRIFGNPRNSGVPEYTDRIIEIKEAAQRISADSFEIIGEACVFDDNGRSIFKGSQIRCSTQDQAKQQLLRYKYPVIVMAFDITELDGRDLTRLPYENRKEILESLLNDSRRDQASIQYLPHTDDRRGLFNEMVSIGGEGVVLKQYGSPYISGESNYWLKVKKWHSESLLSHIELAKDWYGI